MNNLNFVERSITLGFKPSEVNFNPKRHWFGVSAYSPDVSLVKGDKEIVLSLQGVGTRIPWRERSDGLYENYIPEEVVELSKYMGIKYLSFKSDGVILYETWSGVLPSGDFIDSFIHL